MIDLRNFSKYPRVIWNTTKHFLKENSPTILTGLGVAGVITTAVMAAKATPKALAALDEAYVDKNTSTRDVSPENCQDLTPLETLRVAAPYYAPTFVSGIATIAFILGAHSVHSRRYAAVASLYSASEATLKRYKDKVAEQFGAKKAEKVNDSIVQDIIDGTPRNGDSVIKTKNGETIFYDTLSGRYFTSDMEFVRKVQNDINAMIIAENCVSLNELYYQLDLQGIGLGEDVGWNLDTMLDFKFVGALRSDGTPCVALQYNAGPIYNYQHTYH